jgi:hypothetical protein
MGQHHRQRVQTEQTWGGTLNCQIGPLTLGFHAERGSTLLEGGLEGPECNALLHERAGPVLGAGREIGSWIKVACGVAYEPPVNQQHRLANPMVPLVHHCPRALAARAPDPASDGVEANPVWVGGPQLHFTLRRGLWHRLHYGWAVF